jgi:hypothetical protein
MRNSVFILFVFFPLWQFAQQNSVLSSGDWYKIAVEETGVYRITYDDLAAYGMDVDNLNPQYLALFGNPAGMLPEPLDEPYYTDLSPMAIQVVGEGDGSFDPGDYILFYGQAPDVWKWDVETRYFHYVPDVYTEKTYYFLTVGEANGKRMEIESSTEDDFTFTPAYFDFPVVHSEELVNPGKSGKRWLGEDFSQTDTLNFIMDSGGNSLLSDSVYFHVVVAANCSEPSVLSIYIDDAFYKTLTLPVIDSLDHFMTYRLTEFDSLCMAGEGETRISFVYEKPNEQARVWIDYVEMGLRQQPYYVEDSQMPFRSVKSVESGNVTNFVVGAVYPERLKIWNVTDPLNVKDLALTLESYSSVSFRLATDSLLEFQAFNDQSFLTPEFVGMVPNQNLHAMSPPDLLIITHPDFMTQAQQLAAFHEVNDEMSISVVTPEQVYNEFSSGGQDVTAIRNFVRYLYDLSGEEEKPAYVLLVGDASYDYKDRVAGNTNFVPTYESDESANAVNSFATDHYYGLQDMSDPHGNTSTLLAVGRLPVKTQAEADATQAKIETYYSDRALGNWKNEFMFIGDRGDNNLHMSACEELTDTVSAMAPAVNNTKCYLDFYEREESQNGHTNPEAENLIDEKMNSGVFYVNYTGHGGETSLSKDVVVDSSTVAGWNNPDFLPLWVTASCCAVRYDDPGTMSLGEQVVLKNTGGSIGFIGNSRPSFSHMNLLLNLEVLTALLEAEYQGEVRLGDLIKNTSSQFHSEKYNLLGDPALKLSIPEFNVFTTTLNGIDIEEFADTILPGERLNLEGLITSKEDGSVQLGFNGTVHLKVYAPSYMRSTLGSDGSPVMDVMLQDSVLAENTSEVVNGAFQIEVNLPADYYENIGLLKLSWYADNGQTDANGYYYGPVFGGEPSSINEADQLAALIKVYPSPFMDYLSIRLPEDLTDQVVFSVYNLLGTEVYAGQIDGRLHEVRVNLQHLSKGMYVLRLGNSEFLKSFKILKN